MLLANPAPPPKRPSAGLLEQVVAATKQTEPDRAQELVKTLVEQALAGTVTFDRNLTRTFERAIAAIDRMLSAQLNEIMHNERFTAARRQLARVALPRHELRDEHQPEAAGAQPAEARAVPRSDARGRVRPEPAVQTDLRERVRHPGRRALWALIGDYEWTNHPDDVETLRLMSNIAAAAFAPFISGTSSQMFGFKSWTELTRPRDLAKIFDTIEYTKWRSFRDSEDSRFVSLVMPRTLARLPYGAATKPIDEFGYEEAPFDESGAARPMDHGHYCWMNAAYVMGTRLTDAFAQTGFCTAIRGAEGGGKVENLPFHVFTSDDGDLDAKCPTEIAITDRREFELSDIGFLPLCHYKNTDYAVFFGAQSTQKPKKYDRPEATANAAISARLPYLMATSRFAHYLKVMARDWVGSFMEAGDVEQRLNRWIQNYVNANENAGQEMKARFPLREARVEVKDIPGRPGSYNAIAYLRPWLQMEELTTSMRLVARIPQRA
jgi:type VI secretion system protein ImpC